MPAPPPSTSEPICLTAAGEDLQTALRALVGAIPGLPATPTELARTLGLDKSLAWRVMRAVESDGPLQALHATPAPNGLGKLIDAARRAGAGATALEQATEMVARFRLLLARFPGGRGEFESALSAEVPEAKDAADQDARRKIVQGTAHVQGFMTGRFHRMMALRPSAERPDRCDAIRTTMWHGLRRLREGPEYSLAGTSAHRLGDDLHPDPLRTLDGRRPESPDALMIDQFSSSPRLDVRVVHDERHLRMRAADMEIGRSYTIATGDIMLATFDRAKTDEMRYERNQVLTRSAQQLTVNDVLVRDDAMQLARAPFVTMHPNPLDSHFATGGPDDHVDRLDQAFELTDLGSGVDGWRCHDIPGAEDLIAHALSEAGEDPSRYTLHRFTQAWPIPGAVHVWWFDLSGA